MIEPLGEHLTGARLFGNDLTGNDLEQWYANEQGGFFDLYIAQHDRNPKWRTQTGAGALNKRHGSYLPRRSYQSCVAIGCADGADVMELGHELGKVTAIEPSRAWWTEERWGIRFDYRAPELTGNLPLADESVDLCVALAALHHIATVGNVVREMARVLRPGGWLLIREPITSMGDFSKPRPGCTAHERGIPVHIMKQFIAESGLELHKVEFCSVGIFNKLCAKLGLTVPDSDWLVQIDAIVSRLLAFNARYWRPRLIDKLAPNTMVYIACKPVAG